jgi:hypothetical protein
MMQFWCEKGNLVSNDATLLRDEITLIQRRRLINAKELRLYRWTADEGEQTLVPDDATLVPGEGSLVPDDATLVPSATTLVCE